jgi:hypothetical protein
MSQQTVLVDLPPDLYERIRTVAEASHRSLPAVRRAAGVLWVGFGM